MSNEWFVHSDGEQLGPLSPAELKRMVEQGRVSPETPVRLGTEGKWVKAGRVKGLLPAEAEKDKTGSGQVAAVGSQLQGGETKRATNVEERKSRGGQSPERPTHSSVVLPGVPQKATRERRLPERPTVGPLVQDTPLRRTARDLGVGAIILGLSGVVALWLPLVGLPLAALGVVLALAGTSLSLVRRQGGLWVSLAGLVVCLIMLGLGWTLAPRPEPDLATIRSEPKSDRGRMAAADSSLDRAEAEWATFEREAEWLDPAKRGLLGDVEVQIEAVKLDYPMIDDLGEVTKSEQPLLTIRLWLRNTSRARSIVYQGWSGAGSLVDTHVAKLKDHRELNVRPPQMRPGMHIEGQLVNRSITPGEQVPELLVYLPPAVHFEYLMLELPGEAVGATGRLRYRIPADVIEKVVE